MSKKMCNFAPEYEKYGNEKIGFERDGPSDAVVLWG